MANRVHNIEVNLPVTFIREEGKVVAHTPVLDISTVGKNESEAKQRFGELVGIFFSDLIENGSVDAVLTELGWQKIRGQWNPPATSQQSINVQVPAFA